MPPADGAVAAAAAAGELSPDDEADDVADDVATAGGDDDAASPMESAAETAADAVAPPVDSGEPTANDDDEDVDAAEEAASPPPKLTDTVGTATAAAIVGDTEPERRAASPTSPAPAPAADGDSKYLLVLFGPKSVAVRVDESMSAMSLLSTKPPRGGCGPAPTVAANGGGPGGYSDDIGPKKNGSVDGAPPPPLPSRLQLLLLLAPLDSAEPSAANGFGEMERDGDALPSRAAPSW